jgi:hypothetical protein
VTPNDVKVALGEVLANGVSLTTTAYVVFILGWIVTVALGSFLGAFFGKRGETSAVKRDLETIKASLRETTAVTETIKAQMSGDLWERQNRWAFKRDLYIRLLENLRIADAALGHLYDAETRDRVTTESETRKKWLAGHLEKQTTALDEVHRATGVATVILNADAVTALEKLDAELVEARDAESYFNYLDDQLGAVKEAYAALKGAAKADLVLEARS